MSAWIAKWLADKGDVTMAEAAAVLESEATKLIDVVHRRTRRPRMLHTFTLAGFDDHTATVFVVSNYENCFGRRDQKAAATLSTTSRALRSEERALVLITGRSQAVDSTDRRLLKRLATDYPDDGGRLRRRMEEINARAAAPSEAAQLISESCVVLSFHVDGSGVLQLNSAGENPNEFAQLTFGTNMAEQVRAALQSLGVDTSSVNLVQALFASSRSRSSPARPTSVCSFSVATPESGRPYDLMEITTTEDFQPTSAYGISNHGHVVGTGQYMPGQPQNIPWLYHDGHLIRLPFEGATHDVNTKGEVAGTVQGAGVTRAVLFSGGRVVTHPLYHGPEGVFAGTGSAGCAINESGDMAGSVRSITEAQGRPDTRPAMFRAGEDPVAALDVAGNFGSDAVGINGAGLVLVVVVPAIFDARSLLWDPATNLVTYVGGQDARANPVAVNDAGMVLGRVQDERSRPIAVVWEEGGSWRRLGTDGGCEPIDMNDRGDVVGWATVDRLLRVWVRFASGEMVWLPYVREHHCTPAAISNAGEVVGSAYADHGSHAVVWRPRVSG